MANITMFKIAILLVLCVMFIPHLSYSISGCNGQCSTLNDCDGQLICIRGKCNDDPDIGTNICKSRGRGPAPWSGGCNPSGQKTCNGNIYMQYTCSPPIKQSTRAFLTVNNFGRGGDGGAESECDGKFHPEPEKVVALSTGWYAGGSRCGRMIKITARNGRTAIAKVVDECDSVNGCDAEHAGQPPCENNIVDASQAVWRDLGMTPGKEPVTWSMA